MFNFSDVIKNSFLEEFAEISIPSLLTALALSCLLGLFVVLIYRVTFRGVLYNKSFAFSLVLLSMVTSLVLLTVSSNVVLSLGMVGALSIVRFRTAIKDPMDTVFMFWAIAVGITTGAGLISIAVIATLFIGVVFMLLNFAGYRVSDNNYLLIIRFTSDAAPEVGAALKKLPKYRMKSRSTVGSNEEIVLEARMNEKTMKSYEKLKTVEGITEVNFVAYTGSTLL